MLDLHALCAVAVLSVWASLFCFEYSSDKSLTPLTNKKPNR